MTSHIATISINYLQIVMHSLIPSTAEITTGSLWRARLHSPPSLLTNTFKHSGWAKHSRSCLGQLLQLPKIPSQRAATTIMPTFNWDGSVNHLLSSWPVVPSQSLTPSVQRLPGPSRVTQRISGDGTWVCPQAQPPKPATSQLELLLNLSLTYPFCPPALAAGFCCKVFRRPYTTEQQELWACSCKPSVTRVRIVLHLQWHFK